MIIETNNLKKIYRTEEVETTALDTINLKLEEGQFVSVMGPSGCGKSTLLHVLGLIDNPDEDLTTGKRIVHDSKNYMIKGVLRAGRRKEMIIMIAVEGVAT